MSSVHWTIKYTYTVIDVDVDKRKMDERPTKRDRASGGRFTRLIQSRFKTTLLNVAFVRRARKRYSYKSKRENIC